jgi:hypothetical protein
MVIQHDAEEARYQDLVGQRGGGQYENCKIMAAQNSGKYLQDNALKEDRPVRAIPSFRGR